MKETALLQAYLAQHTRLSKAETETVCAAFTLKIMDASQLLQKNGHHVTHISFIAQGVIRAFVIDNHGNEITKFFLSENQFVVDLNGLQRGQHAYLNIQAITPCRLLTIPIKEVAQLNSAIPSLSGIVQDLSSSILLDILKAQDTVRGGTATQKYQRFVKHYPQIYRQIPLKYIAAYLGIAQQSLSRIRKNAHRIF